METAQKKSPATTNSNTGNANSNFILPAPSTKDNRSPVARLEVLPW